MWSSLSAPQISSIVKSLLTFIYICKYKCMLQIWNSFKYFLLFLWLNTKSISVLFSPFFCCAGIPLSWQIEHSQRSILLSPQFAKLAGSDIDCKDIVPISCFSIEDHDEIRHFLRCSMFGTLWDDVVSSLFSGTTLTIQNGVRPSIFSRFLCFSFFKYLLLIIPFHLKTQHFLLFHTSFTIIISFVCIPSCSSIFRHAH